MTGASESEAREFAKAFRSFLEWVHSERAGAGDRNEVAALVGDFLGGAGLERSVVSRSLAAFEHVNLQTALDAWSREPGREGEVQGVSTPPHYPAAARDRRGYAAAAPVGAGAGRPPRSLLGVGEDRETPASGGGPSSLPPSRGRGWVGSAPRRLQR